MEQTWKYTKNIIFSKSVTKCTGSFHVKSTHVTQPDPLRTELFFCEIVVPMEISIPAKFYCFMATIFLEADIQSYQKRVFWAQVVLEKVA
jgi:hypothetical protein